jgi:hypothetical protein
VPDSLFGRSRQERPRSDGEKWLDSQTELTLQSLSPREIARAGLRAGWRRIGRVVLITGVVFGLLGAAEALLKSYFNAGDSWPQIFAELALAGINVIGVTFLAGVFGRAVGAAEHGFPEQSIWQIFRTVPYGRLVEADFLVTLWTAIGLLMLVVPGLAAFTLLALTAAAVRLERRTGMAALRRSAQIVRHHYWTVFLLSTIPLTIGSVISDLVEGLAREPFIVYFLVRLVATGSGAAICGLMQSELGFRLLAVTRVQEQEAAAKAQTP